MTLVERPRAAAAVAPSALVRLHTVCPLPVWTSGIAGIPLEFCDAIVRHPELRERYQVQNWVTCASRLVARPYLRGMTNRLIARLVQRLPGGEARLKDWTMGRLRAACRPGDLVVSYPGSTSAHVAGVRATGAMIVHDPVNTAYPLGWELRERGYQAAGMPSSWRPDARYIADERDRLDPADLVFVCSPQLQVSYEALGVPRQRLLPSSYGFNPATFQPVRRATSRPTFLFAGTGSVRKGLPLLLRAWARAKIDGRLLVVGGVESEVAAHCEQLLRQPTVELRPYTSDLASVYGEADAFVLTSFEEGSPLVSYLALAAGLPCVVSPVAAGWVVRDGLEGLVVAPEDVDAIAGAMRRLADDRGLRDRLAHGATVRSADYTWDRVAMQRRAALEPFLGD